MSIFEAIAWTAFSVLGAFRSGAAEEEETVATGGFAPIAATEIVGLLLKFVFKRRAAVVSRSSPPDELRFLGDLFQLYT